MRPPPLAQRGPAACRGEGYREARQFTGQDPRVVTTLRTGLYREQTHAPNTRPGGRSFGSRAGLSQRGFLSFGQLRLFPLCLPPLAGGRGRGGGGTCFWVPLAVVRAFAPNPGQNRRQRVCAAGCRGAPTAGHAHLIESFSILFNQSKKEVTKKQGGRSLKK